MKISREKEEKTVVTKGIYLLQLRLAGRADIGFDSREFVLRKGYYVYIGSAMNGLEGRLGRHLKVSERRHWHIDDLLVRGKLVDIQLAITGKKEDECLLADLVGGWQGATAVPGFGSTDCKCETHLFHFDSRAPYALLAGQVRPEFREIFTSLNASYTNHAVFERDPFETLITCVLSLRTQDPVTHEAAKRLFAWIQKPAQFVRESPGAIAEVIYPVGMYREKAKRLVEISRMLLNDYKGRVPDDIDELVKLPGVGRKTANLVVSFAFHLPAICVDTHVHRITNRWGVVRTATPDESEMALRRLLPRQYWIEINPLLVQHGQQVCRPLYPRCDHCKLKPYCQYSSLENEAVVLGNIRGAPGHPSLVFRKKASAKTPKRSPKMQSPFE